MAEELGTAIAEAPTGETTGFDINGVDEMLAGDSHEATGTEDATEEAAQPGTEGEIEPAVEATADDWAEGIAPTVIDGPNGTKLHQYAEEQSRALQGHAKFVTELQAAIPDITVDDAVAHNHSHTDLIKIAADMRRGTPEAAERFANMVLKESGKSPFVGELASRLVQTVKSTHPEAYARIQDAVETELENELYALAQKVASHPDKNIKDGYAQLAQLLYYHRHNGETKPVGQHAAVDPLAEREAKIQQREKEAADRDRTATEQRQGAWKSAAVSQTGTQLRSEIEKMIDKPIRDRYKANPELLPMIMNHVQDQARKAIFADPEWKERFDIEYDDALREGTKDSLQRVVNRYLARGRSILKTQLPKMLSSASSDTVQQNGQRREQLRRASSASHRIPGANGKPAPQSITVPPGKFNRPEDYERYLDSTVN